MTRVHLPGTSPWPSRRPRRQDGQAEPSGSRRRRVLTVATLLVAVPVTAATVAGSAAANITGYGPVGADPATELGLSAPVLTAEVSGPGGSTVQAAVAGATIEVTRPAGYSDGSQVVSLTDLSGPGPAETLVPAELLQDSHVVLGVGVGVRTVDTVPGASGVSGVDGAPLGEEVVVAGEPDSLVMRVDSPALAGGTVVVVGEDRHRVVPGGTSVTLDLAGPSAVFALAPGPAPAGAGEEAVVGGAEVPQQVAGQPFGAVEATVGPAASNATGSATATGTTTGTATLAGALVLGSIVAAGSGTAVARHRRATRRRSQP